MSIIVARGQTMGSGGDARRQLPGDLVSSPEGRGFFQ